MIMTIRVVLTRFWMYGHARWLCMYDSNGATQEIVEDLHRSSALSYIGGVDTSYRPIRYLELPRGRLVTAGKLVALRIARGES